MKKKEKYPKIVALINSHDGPKVGYHYWATPLKNFIQTKVRFDSSSKPYYFEYETFLLPWEQVEMYEHTHCTQEEMEAPLGDKIKVDLREFRIYFKGRNYKLAHKLTKELVEEINNTIHEFKGKDGKYKEALKIGFFDERLNPYNNNIFDTELSSITLPSRNIINPYYDLTTFVEWIYKAIGRYIPHDKITVVTSLKYNQESENYDIQFEVCRNSIHYELEASFYYDKNQNVFIAYHNGLKTEIVDDIDVMLEFIDFYLKGKTQDKIDENDPYYEYANTRSRWFNYKDHKEEEEESQEPDFLSEDNDNGLLF